MPNCIQHPEQECFGMAEAQILRQQIESMQEQMKQERKERKREHKGNKKDHKEFFRRMEFSEKAQALTQSQNAQILQTTLEIRAAQEEQSRSIQEIKAAQQAHATAIETLTGKQTTQEQKIEDITKKPGKNWESLKTTVFSLLVAAIVALVLAKIGLTT